MDSNESDYNTKVTTIQSDESQFGCSSREEDRTQELETKLIKALKRLQKGDLSSKVFYDKLVTGGYQ